MKIRALGALLLILAASPLPGLCAVCVSDVCPLGGKERQAFEDAPAVTPAYNTTATPSCHSEPTPPPCPALAVENVAFDCCMDDEERGTSPVLIHGKAPQTDAMPAAANSVVVPAPRAAVFAVSVGPPEPLPLRPLYTLYSSLLL